MNPVLSVQQMRTIDRQAINNDAAVGYRYMQKAGMGLFHAARELAPDSSAGEIAIMCGKGNNGGDGYVAGSLLVKDGYRVTCYSLVPIEELRGECLLAYQDYVAARSPVMTLDDSADFPHPSRFCLIIDALLGTGLRGAPHGLYAHIITIINNSGLPVLAVDTPSGLDNDSGRPATPCIKATATVAMGFSKPGHHFYPGRQWTGRLYVEDLGYPDELIANAPPIMWLPDITDYSRILPQRRPDGSKFDHGQVLLTGGSPGMTGSVTLMAEAALRCGCGMVHCAVPQSIADTLSVKLTEPVLHTLPATENGVLDTAALEPLLELVAPMQALCIGPGLAHDPATTALVRAVIGNCPTPILLDADGINAFKGCAEELGRHTGELLITPHAGEWQRLFGPLPEAPLERIARLRETAIRLGISILLKGNPTLVAAPQGTVVIVRHGNSALAKAGSGDVLSGCIASLIAQGTPVTDAAILGAYLHGNAGELASREHTEYSVTARAITDYLAPSIRTLL